MRFETTASAAPPLPRGTPPFALGLAVLLLALAPGGAQGAEEEIALYQVSSGQLELDKGWLTAMRDVGKRIRVPVAMYIIDHPRGLVLFDTGCAAAVSDGGCDSYWGASLCESITPIQRRDQVIDRWLTEFGYHVDDVRYVIYSHFHLDHAGNIELFPKAQHVVQKEELKAAWWPETWQRSAFVLKDYDAARDFQYLELSGDFDLFADGSIVVLDTKGHTQGHQSLLVRLPETGTVILAGDAVYTEENERGAIPGITWNTYESMRSIERLKQLRDAERGEIWYSHDLEQYESHRHDAPYK